MWSCSCYCLQFIFPIILTKIDGSDWKQKIPTHNHSTKAMKAVKGQVLESQKNQTFKWIIKTNQQINKSTNQIQNSKSKTKSISPLSLLLYRVWWRLGFDDRFVPLASQLLLCSKDHSLQRPKNFHCICAHKTTNSLGFLYPSLDHLSASLFVSFFFSSLKVENLTKKECEMLDYYEQLAASPYNDSLKVLEADIQHANMLWVQPPSYFFLSNLLFLCLYCILKLGLRNVK